MVEYRCSYEGLTSCSDIFVHSQDRFPFSMLKEQAGSKAERTSSLLCHDGQKDVLALCTISVAGGSEQQYFMFLISIKNIGTISIKGWW